VVMADPDGKRSYLHGSTQVTDRGAATSKRTGQLPHEGIDTSTSTGRLVFPIFAAPAHSPLKSTALPVTSRRMGDDLQIHRAVDDE
jgi:hypothetical protein